MSYFLSKDVKVFPCAYRGYTGANAEVIDPYARSFAEYNFSNIYANISANKQSYIISYVNNVLKCVIGGYYFEISNVGDGENQYSFKWLGIKIKEVNDNDNKSAVLANFDSDNVDYLDYKAPDASDFTFLGLSFSNEEDGNSNVISLHVFDDNGNLCECEKRLADSFGPGDGRYSVRSYDAENAGEANGLHAIALGRNVTARHDYSTVIGKNIETSASYQVLVGSGEDGLNKYVPDSDILIQAIKNGENVISVSKTGDIETANFSVENGNLEVSGSITASKKLTISSEGADITGDTTINGDLTADGNINLSEGLVIVNKATDEQHPAKAEINCATDITGATNITGNTAITGTTTSNGKITGNNGLEITDGATTLKDITVEAATINSTLRATGTATLGATTVNGKITVSGGINVKDGANTVIINSAVTERINNVDVTKQKVTFGADVVDMQNADIIANSITIDSVDTNSLDTTSLNLNGSALSIGNWEGNDFDKENPAVPDPTKIKNNNALVLEHGIHAGGMLTIWNPEQDPSKKLETGLAIFDTDANKTLKAKIRTDGSAFFAQKLMVGGYNDNININPVLDPMSSYIEKLTNIGGYLWSDEYRTIIKGNLAIGEDTYIGGKISTSASSSLYVGEYIKLNDNNSGRIVALGYNTPSDIRLKTNIKPYYCEKSILDLPVVEFDYIGNGIHRIGCIAQDVKKICPEIVHEDDNGYLSVEENKLVYLLLNEVKKLKEEIKSLRGK